MNPFEAFLQYVMLHNVLQRTVVACHLRTGHWYPQGNQKENNCCVCLALAFHISCTMLLNRLLAMSSSSDVIGRKPFRACTISLRL